MFKKFKMLRSNKRIVVSSLVLIAAGVVLWLFLNKAHPTNQTIPVKTNPSKATPQDLASNGPSSDKQTSPAQGFSGSSDKSTGSTSSLIAPSGNFVSNHSPGGNGAPTEEQSVCNTSPGASCYIRFTKDSDTRTLPAQTADSNGSVIWSSWDVRTANFSNGEWQITALATLNGQTKTTTDPLPLKVEP